MSVPTDVQNVVNANYDQQMIAALRHSPLRHAPKNPLGVVAHPANPDAPPHILRAWPALTPEEREAGLQFCTNLEPNTGVLFVFPGEFFWPMWMKDTPLPLDIVFLRSSFGGDGTVTCEIVDVREGKPFDLTHITPRDTCDMVLEMQRGQFGFGGKRGRRGVRALTISGYETALLRAIRVCPPGPIEENRPNAAARAQDEGDDSLPPSLGASGAVSDALGFKW